MPWWFAGSDIGRHESLLANVESFSVTHHCSDMRIKASMNTHINIIQFYIHTHEHTRGFNSSTFSQTLYDL